MSRGESPARGVLRPPTPVAQARAARTKRGIVDPFGERAASTHRLHLELLGATFRFEAANRALLALVKHAYQRLPSHRFDAVAPSVTVRLIATADDAAARWRTPPPVRTVAGGGVVAGTVDAANFAVLTPAARSGLVAISPRMLRFDYHARYELLEFAVFTLAARVQSLVPLHAACLGAHGRAVLLVGDAGAGKSTLALHGLLAGLDFTSEDSSFVSPARSLVTGVANFVHVRTDALALVEDARARERLRRSPVIRRRSGVDKFEIDARRARYRLALSPSRLAAVVFVSPQRAPNGPLLRPLSAARAAVRLAATQPFAAGQPGWQRFLDSLGRIACMELRRGPDVAAGVDALRRLLQA